MKVADVMSAQVSTCSPEDSLSRAAQLMWEGDCGVVVVIDGARRPVGMLTDRDICMATWSQERSPREIPVRGAMATSVVTCTHGQDVATVHTTLRQHQLRRLPVVDTAGALVGVVSVSDLIQDAARTTGSPRGQGAEHVLETMGAVTRPHGVEPVAVIPAAEPSAPGAATPAQEVEAAAASTPSKPSSKKKAAKAKAPAKAATGSGTKAPSSKAPSTKATSKKAPASKTASKTAKSARKSRS